MSVNISQIQAYDSVDDRDIICMYQKERKEIYAAVLLFRYEHLLYKIISQWNARNYHLSANDSDMMDVRHYAYLALLVFMANTKEPRRIKNVGTRLKSFVYYILDKYYRHRRYEENTGINVPDLDDNIEHYVDNVQSTESDDSVFSESKHLYFIYKKKYTYYKIALMMCGSESRGYMKQQVNRLKKKLLSGFKNKFTCPDKL